MAKTAFENLARNSHYVADPNDLMIIGGSILPEDERGPLDTAHKKGEHDLWDERLHNEVTDAEVANVDTFGVIEPILIAKDPVSGEPMVVAGRQRVRRARRANILRAKRGEPPIKIDCKITRATGTNLLSIMIAEYTDSGVVNEAIVLLEDETSDITPEQRHVVDAYYVGVKRALELVFGKSTDAELLKMLAKARKA